MVESVLGRSLFTLREPCVPEPCGNRGHFAWVNTASHRHTHRGVHAPMHVPVVIGSNTYSQCNQRLQNHGSKLEAKLGVAMDITVCLEEWVKFSKIITDVGCSEDDSFIVNLIFWSGVLLKMRLFKAILSLDYGTRGTIFPYPTICHASGKNGETCERIWEQHYIVKTYQMELFIKECLLILL